MKSWVDSFRKMIKVNILIEKLSNHTNTIINWYNRKYVTGKIDQIENGLESFLNS